MVGEVFADFSAAKAAFDIAKGLKDLDDRTRRNAAVIELQEQILAAQAEQAAAIERIRHLEKQVADFEAWDAEKKRYELKNIGHSCFARMLCTTRSKPYLTFGARQWCNLTFKFSGRAA